MPGEFRALNLLLDLVRDQRDCVRLAVGRLHDLAAELVVLEYDEPLVSRLAALAVAEWLGRLRRWRALP